MKVPCGGFTLNDSHFNVDDQGMLNLGGGH